MVLEFLHNFVEKGTQDLFYKRKLITTQPQSKHKYTVFSSQRTRKEGGGVIEPKKQSKQ